MQTQTYTRVCITVSNSANPSNVYIGLRKHGKRFLSSIFMALQCIPHTNKFSESAVIGA